MFRATALPKGVSYVLTKLEMTSECFPITLPRIWLRFSSPRIFLAPKTIGENNPFLCAADAAAAGGFFALGVGFSAALVGGDGASLVLTSSIKYGYEATFILVAVALANDGPWDDTVKAEDVLMEAERASTVAGAIENFMIDFVAICFQRSLLLFASCEIRKYY